MNGNSRQRAISDYNFAKNKVQFVVQLYEGRLHINVARIGTMYPFVKLTLGTEERKSDLSEIGGLHPKWNQFFSFGLTLHRMLELTVYDKSLLFGETEIGRCTISLVDVLQGRQTEWWDIVSPTGQLAGAIFLMFEFPESESCYLHSSQNSWDLKMHHHIGSSPGVARAKSKNSTQMTKLTPEIKKVSSGNGTLMTETLDFEEFENNRSDLIEKQERVKNQELVYLNHLQKLREESELIRNEKHEIKKSNEVLLGREEDILKEKEWIRKERGDIEGERESIRKQLEGLNSEYLKLKKEKLGVRARKAAQKNRKRVVDRDLARVTQQLGVKKTCKVKAGC